MWEDYSLFGPHVQELLFFWHTELARVKQMDVAAFPSSLIGKYSKTLYYNNIINIIYNNKVMWLPSNVKLKWLYKMGGLSSGGKYSWFVQLYMYSAGFGRSYTGGRHGAEWSHKRGITVIELLAKQDVICCYSASRSPDPSLVAIPRSKPWT